jgi:hypothetical protein
MKTKIYLLPVLLLAIFSCKKNSDDVLATQNKPTKYIEEFISASTTFKDTFTVNYDNAGRVLSLVSTNPTDRFNFMYNGNVSYTIDIINNGVLDIRFNAYFNSNGFVDSTFQYNNTNENLVTETEYTSTGSLAEKKIYEYSNIVGNSPSFFGIGYPARSKNLIKKTTFYNSSNAVTQVVDFEYTFDTMSRMIAEKQILSGGGVYTRSFIY